MNLNVFKIRTSMFNRLLISIVIIIITLILALASPVLSIMEREFTKNISIPPKPAGSLQQATPSVTFASVDPEESGEKRELKPFGDGQQPNTGLKKGIYHN